MTHLTICYRSPSELVSNPTNSRLHTKKQVRQLAKSITSFGFNVPILVDRDDMIVCGHGRWLAAQLLELEQVPTIRLEHLTEAQRRAFVIADNRLAELSQFDEKVLASELEELQSLDLGFDIIDTGFEIAEIDARISALHEPETVDPADQPVSNVRAVARRGDLWSLGAHRLFCGDSLDPLSYRVLLGGERAQMAFTDPPYNVQINGHVSGNGKVRHAEFAMASGEMTSTE
ncbi:MAG: site-specific DNA-methyltransferase, partial [Zymomonas sp.]